MGAPDLHLGKQSKAYASVEDLAKLPGLERLADPLWRLTSGELYKIIVKDDNDPDAEGTVMAFKPNRAQRRLIKRLWHRNIILKARQLGFTTLVALLWLDFALFNANVRCGIIAQDDEIAKVIFRDKVMFGYENLPDVLRDAMPLRTANAHELVFEHNNSSIRVATSMRGGTIHRLHISEFGKICAKFPAKAAEVISGSIPAVPSSGILIIESTAEGQDGAFYRLTQAALKLFQRKAILNPKQYRFHFFAWWQDDDYRMDPANVIITDKDHEYFDMIEGEMQTTLDLWQRAWYVATRNEFEDAGEGEKMLQEYPSTPKEAFQKSISGTYYAKEMARVRKEQRICKIPLLEMPCWTFWDIGGTAGTAIWVIQQVGMEYRCIDYYEAHNETYGHAVRWLKEKNYLYAKHFLPHDADHERQLSTVNKSPKQMLEDLLLTNIEIIPVIESLDVGIELMKKYFPMLWFDETRCAEGIKRIDGYKRKWDSRQGTWRNEPEKHDGNSEAADALRQFAQAMENGMLNLAAAPKRKRSSNWRTA
jgi:hypothetical protein